MRVGVWFSIPFHMKLFVGVKAVILHEGKVLIVREAAYDEGTNKGKWDVSGGRIQNDEPILIGLAREVKEESGLEIKPMQVLGVSETFPTIKGELCHIVRIYYLAEALHTKVTLGPDHDTYAWVTVEDINDKELVSSLLELIVKALER